MYIKVFYQIYMYQSFCSGYVVSNYFVFDLNVINASKYCVIDYVNYSVLPSVDFICVSQSYHLLSSLFVTFLYVLFVSQTFCISASYLYLYIITYLFVTQLVSLSISEKRTKHTSFNNSRYGEIQYDIHIGVFSNFAGPAPCDGCGLPYCMCGVNSVPEMTSLTDPLCINTTA